MTLARSRRCTRENGCIASVMASDGKHSMVVKVRADDLAKGRRARGRDALRSTNGAPDAPLSNWLAGAPKNGYHARVTVDLPDGKSERRRPPLGTFDKGRAERMKNKIVRELEAGRLVADAKETVHAPETIEVAARAWCEDRKARGVAMASTELGYFEHHVSGLATSGVNEQTEMALSPHHDSDVHRRYSKCLISERGTGFEPATSSLGSWHSTN